MPPVVPAIRVVATTPVSSTVPLIIVCWPLANRPRVVLKVTAVPLGTGLPALSKTVAVMAVELTLSAGMLGKDEVNVI